MLVENTMVPQSALPVEAFKAHLRLGSGFADDGLQDSVLAGFLRAALAAIEGRTGKFLFERDFDWTIDGWREIGRVVLPVAPVSAVTGFDLIDATDGVMPVDPALWRLVPDMQRPYLQALGGIFPTIPKNGSARIGLLAGYGPEFSDLPHDLAQAAMMLAAHYFEYRTDTALGAGCMPFGVTALIERYRSVRLTMAGWT